LDFLRFQKLRFLKTYFIALRKSDDSKDDDLMCVMMKEVKGKDTESQEAGEIVD